MKNLKLFISLCLLITANSLFSQSFSWVKTAGSTGTEAANGVAVDASGNVYTTGLFASTCDFDPSGTSYTLTSAGVSDVYIEKRNSSGVLQWVKAIGSSGTDAGAAIAVDASSNVYITGYFSGTVDFDPSAATYTMATAGPSSDAFVLKLNSSGNFLWAKNIGGSGPDKGLSIAVNSTGDVYSTGYFSQTADLDPSAATYTLSSGNANFSTFDVYISKLNSAGNFVWAQQIASVGNTHDFGNDIALDASGNVYVTGNLTASSVVDLDPSTTASYTVQGMGGSTYDAFYVKLNSAGAFQFGGSLAGASNEYGLGIDVDASGGVILTGYSESTSIDLNPGVAVNTFTNAGLKDIFIVKLSSTGVYSWANLIGSTGDDQARNVQVDGSNNIYITGAFSGTVDFDSGSGTDNHTAVGADIFILKLNSTGLLIWALDLGGNSNEYGLDIVVDGTNNVYTCGYYGQTVDFDPSAAVFNVTTEGAEDSFTLKLAPCTAPIVTITGTTAICSGNSTVLTASGATTYSWSPSGVTTVSATLSPTSTTIYTVTGTSGGCSGTKTVTVNVTATPTVAVSNVSICPGSAASLNASGATTYSWNTGAITAAISVTPAVYTVYTVTGTTSGCTNTKTVSVTIKTTPTVTVNSATICVGQSATLTATGGSNYIWNTTATTSIIVVTPTITTTYSVIGTNSVGCTQTKTTSVVVNLSPTVSANNATICSGSSTTLAATGATTYNWNTGATSSSIVVTPTATIIYTVVGTTSGCTNTKTVSVSVNASPTVTVNNTIICSGSSATLTVSGATNYNWNTGATSPSIVVTPTANTVYTVVGTTSGCSNTKTVSVSVNPSPTVAVSNASICAGSSATLVATGATNYNWNTGATSSSIVVTPTATTIYTVVGTTSGCTNTKTITLTINALPNTSVASSTICSGSTGTLVASGANTYSWNTGATGPNLAVSPIVNTNYTVTGVSAAGCVKTATASVTVGSAPSIAANSANICIGNTATLTASGVNTYTWNTNSNSPSITVNPTSTTVYTVSGNLVGCAATAVKVVTVTVNALPIVTLGTISSPLCVNNAAVVLSGSPAGGVYSGTGVSGSNFDPSVSGAGTYIVMYNYTDANSCSASDAKSVTVNSLPVVTLATISSPLCVNNAAVSLSGSPAGGIYSGLGVSGSNFDPSVSGAGTFTVTYDYTDANSCSAADSKTVNVSLCTDVVTLSGVEASSISIYPNPASQFVNIKSDKDGTIKIMDVAGKIVLTQEMNNGITEINLSDLSKGLYIISVKENDTQLFNSKLIKD